MTSATDLSKLRSKVQASKLNNCLFRIVLIRGIEEKNEWFIYFGQIILSSSPFEIDSRILYQNKKIIIAEFVGNSGDVSALVNAAQEKEKYFINGILNEYDIHSKIRSLSEYFFPSFQAKEIGMPYPIDEMRLYFSEDASHCINRDGLVHFRSLNELIREILKVDLDKLNGLQNTLSFYFKKGLGFISDVVTDGKTLNIKLKYSEKDKDSYSLRLFIDYPDGDKEVKDLNVNKELTYKFEYVPQKLELRLIYKDFLADSYQKYFEGDDKTDLLSHLNISEFKLKVSAIKAEIKTKGTMQLGEFVEKRLNDAENKIKSDPNDAIQALGEAIETLCKDYLDIFDIHSKSVGMKLHSKIIRHWKNETEKNWLELLYQTGIRHIIKINNLKKHHKYESNEIEVSYLILLAWKGYWEVLRMIKEVQNIDGS